VSLFPPFVSINGRIKPAINSSINAGGVFSAKVAGKKYHQPVSDRFPLRNAWRSFDETRPKIWTGE